MYNIQRIKYIGIFNTENAKLVQWKLSSIVDGNSNEMKRHPMFMNLKIYYDILPINQQIQHNPIGILIGTPLFGVNWQAHSKFIWKLKTVKKLKKKRTKLEALHILFLKPIAKPCGIYS